MGHALDDDDNSITEKRRIIKIGMWAQNMKHSQGQRSRSQGHATW